MPKPGHHDVEGEDEPGPNEDLPGEVARSESEVGATKNEHPGSEDEVDQSEEDGGGHGSCCSRSDNGLGSDVDDDTVVELAAAGIAGLAKLSVAGVGTPEIPSTAVTSSSRVPEALVVPARVAGRHIARPERIAHAGTHDRDDIGPGFHDIDRKTGLSYDCPGCGCTRHCSLKQIGEPAAIARLLAWATQCPGTTQAAHRDIGKRLLADFASADPS